MEEPNRIYCLVVQGSRVPHANDASLLMRHKCLSATGVGFAKFINQCVTSSVAVNSRNQNLTSPKISCSPPYTTRYAFTSSLPQDVDVATVNFGSMAVAQ